MTNVRSIPEMLKSFELFMHEIHGSKTPALLYEPVSYILSLGGKRIRPLALLHLNELLLGNEEAAMHAAYGIELFHNFSLIHDDIMDASLMRRSKETVHRKFGLNAAILSGDVMLIESMRHIQSAESISGCRELLLQFIPAAREVCEGQAMDIEFESQLSIEYAEYLEMIRKKTAVLLAYTFMIATILSGRNELSREFYQAGIHTGLAYQLEDDWLDFFAEVPGFGKTQGGDILQFKKSALVLELMDQLEGSQRKSFENWYASEKDSANRLTMMSDYLHRYGIREKLRQRIEEYQSKAIHCIESLSLTEFQKKKITEFLQSIFSRTF